LKAALFVVVAVRTWRRILGESPTCLGVVRNDPEYRVCHVTRALNACFAATSLSKRRLRNNGDQTLDAVRAGIRRAYSLDGETKTESA
jgi:hypothetical protein